jgi:2-polyprenyl-3-methyl-5-hydroxy-6-metoxy-1,4-benzoquinol methylase
MITSTSTRAPQWLLKMPSDIMYRGPIRSGQFGQRSGREYAVRFAKGAALGYLDPFPQIDYSSAEYRVSVNGSAAIDTYFQLHDRQQPGYLGIIQPFLSRASTVVDCGAGGGAMLDCIHGMVSRTIAVEPLADWHASLRERGHVTYGSMAECGCRERGSVSVALSVHVIEHVIDPVAYLREIGDLLTPGGTALVFTPNLHDILMSLDFEHYAPFFFREQHNYYFTAKGLEVLAGAAGLAVVRSGFYHDFPIANAFGWVANRVPAEHSNRDCFDASVDGFWKGYLESRGLASQVYCVFRKPAVQ